MVVSSHCDEGAGPSITPLAWPRLIGSGFVAQSFNILSPHGGI